MFRIHDLMSQFNGLNVPGLPYYADRALILPGTVVVRDGPIDEHLRYLRQVNVGADRVLKVPEDSLIGAAATDGPVRRQLISHLRRGGQVQFFCSTRQERDLLLGLGSRIGWSQAFSAPDDLSVRVNDKSDLRRIARTLGLAGALLPYRVCRDAAGIRQAVERLRTDGCDFVVMKRPDLASGDGMELVRPDDDAAAVVGEYWRKHAGHAIIVEAGHRHQPMSVQWEVTSQVATFACATDQLIDEPFTHLGNVISSHRLPFATEDDIAAMRRISEPLVNHFRMLSYRGVCGFDFLRSRRDGRLYLLECNGRVTATTYALGLARQLAPRLPQWAVLMTNLPVAAAYADFPAVAWRLGPLLFNGTTGVLPFNVRCLGLPQPKVAVCCVAADTDSAQDLYLQAATALR